MSRFARSVYQLLAVAKEMKLGVPPVNARQAERVVLLVAKARKILDDIARVCAEHYRDSDVEPGPEGRAAIIEEREADGFRQIVAGPKTTQRTEVVS
jgi:hypothetical protein